MADVLPSEPDTSGAHHWWSDTVQGGGVATPSPDAPVAPPPAEPNIVATLQSMGGSDLFAGLGEFDALSSNDSDSDASDSGSDSDWEDLQMLDECEDPVAVC